MNSGSNAALSRFTLSGTHSSNFFDVCDGRHEIYYLQKHLESKPDYVATVVAELPEEVFMVESSEIPSSTISSVSKRKRDKESVIVEAL